MTIRAKTGRPPKRATTPEPVILTLRIPPHIKNTLIDQADAYDLTITEYLIALITRDAEAG